MADKSNFNATVDALFKGMDSFVTTKTVVGEAMEVGNVTMSAAAGAYQSLVGFLLVLTANLVVRRIDRESALF